MTNAGLQIKLEVLFVRFGSRWGEKPVAVLDCHYMNDFRGPLGIAIQIHSSQADSDLASRRNMGLSPVV